ncbi:HNH endonuclease [Arthrobacter alpinus]|uniref:HNH endonuclease n=1 Tax=Arthrobacter alpinus TaxID=656366 RepID=UPI000AC74FC7|nr:HNH endonuclease [Arthrobacter alpinus]
MSDSVAAVGELSRILNLSGLHPVEHRSNKFRNPAGVARKTADIATQHPDYLGKPTNGNRLDREVLTEFLEEPLRMQMIAEEITASILRGESVMLPDEDIDEAEGSASEGRLLAARHFRRERSPRLRAKKIEESRKKGLPIVCNVCSFAFGSIYGERGFEYIEVHHVLPLHVSGEVQTKLSDLVMLCANCHRMIHRGKRWLTVEELRAVVALNSPDPVLVG